MNMGEKILKLRKARGWSQEELAEQLNVTRQAVSRWESDAAKPDADKITALCGIFGVSADYLLCMGAGSNVSPAILPTRSAESTDKNVLYRMIAGIVLLAVSVVLFIALLYMSVLDPCTYGINDVEFDGVLGYVLVRDLQWVAVGMILMFVVGMAMVFWKFLCRVCGWFSKQKECKEGAR